MSEIVHRKRVCIVGTAPSWEKTPWNDATIECWSLNDAYVLGMPRIDRLYELHPLNKMWFRKKDQTRVHEEQVPPGHFVRPEGHLEFLQEAAKTIPVFLQDTPPDGWPAKAYRFPIEAVHEAFGSDYWASGPVYMLAQAVLEGYTDIWITGIHLSTEQEYREQRPNFEALINRILGRRVTLTKQDGFRFYQGESVRIVLPDASPIMTHGWRYAYEDRPKKESSALDREWKDVQKEKMALISALVNWPVGQDKKKAMARLQRLEVIEFDIQQQKQRQQIQKELAITVHPVVMPVAVQPVPVQVGG